MSLIIKPVKSSVFCVVSGFPFSAENSDEYGPIVNVMFSNDTIIPDDSSATGYVCREVRGSIRTSPSLIRNQHDCDNLQLSGTVTDRRNMTNMKFSPNLYGTHSNLLWVRRPGKTSWTPIHATGTPGTSTYVLCSKKGRPFKNVVIVGCTASFDTTWWTYVGMTGKSDPITFRVWYQKLQTGGTWILGGYQDIPFIGKQDLSNIQQFLDACTAGAMYFTANQGVVSYSDTRFISSSSCLLSDQQLMALYQSDKFDWLTALNDATKTQSSFGDLHYRALSKIDAIDINSFAYAKDVKNILEEIRGWFSLLRGDVNPKNLADAFLSWKYGMRLTYGDTKTLVSDWPVNGKASGVSATDVQTVLLGELKCVSTVRLHHKNDVFSSLKSFLNSIDLDVNRSNVWELIPFSFVVDWLYDVDGLLKRFDLNDLISHYIIDSVFDTTIYTGQIDSARLQVGFAGSIFFRRYLRVCSFDAEFPLITPSSPSITSHWLESTALIVQRLGR